MYCFVYFKGEEVSLTTKNDLLALVAYRGLGSGWVPKEKAPEILETFKDLSWWPGGEDSMPSLENEVGTEGRKGGQPSQELSVSQKKIKNGFKVWRLVQDL